MARPRKAARERHDNPRYPKFTDDEAARLYRLSRMLDVPENVLIRSMVTAYLDRYEHVFKAMYPAESRLGDGHKRVRVADGP